MQIFKFIDHLSMVNHFYKLRKILIIIQIIIGIIWGKLVWKSNNSNNKSNVIIIIIVIIMGVRFCNQEIRNYFQVITLN